MKDNNDLKPKKARMPNIAEGFMNETYSFEDSYWWFEGLRCFIKKGLDILSKNGICTAQGKGIKPFILDAACGTGSNILLLRQYGETIGVDILDESLKGCRARGLDMLAKGSIAELPVSSGTFDVILSCDALQCLGGDMDVKALGEFGRVLKPGGGLIMNVAANKSLSGSHSVASGEERRFEREELRSKLYAAGFEVILMSYVYFFTFPIVFLRRILQRRLSMGSPVPSKSDFFKIWPPLNTLLLSLMHLEASLINTLHFPFGSSLFSVSLKKR